MAAALMAVASLLLTACGSNPDAKVGSTACDVLVVRADTADVSGSSVYSGTIEASESLPLSFSLPGTVSQVLVSEGQAVHRGQLLAVMDPTSYKNTNDMMQAALQRAEDAHRRIAPMHDNGTIPEIKFTEVQTALAQAQASAAIAKKNLDDCRLVATCDGFVGRRSIDPGMTAVPGLSTITIVRLGRVHARVPVPENDIAGITRGRRAQVTIGALGRTVEGMVEDVGVVADPLAHTYAITIAIDNPRHELRPGMVCSATVETAARHRGITVPARAVIVDDAGESVVYVVDAGADRARRVVVRTGRLVNDRVEIVEGLTGGELVVVAGQHKLIPDAPVRVVAH